MKERQIEQRGRTVRLKLDQIKTEELNIGHEKLKNDNIEIRYANFEKDAQGIAELWNQESVIEHLAGVGPVKTPPGINLRKYRLKRRLPILIAEPNEIKEFENNPNIKTIVAIDTFSGKVVGTVQVGFPAERAFGIKTASVEKLAVHEEKRGKGIARKLLRTAHALIYSIKDKEGNYAYTGVRAGIINNVKGADAAWMLFKKAGYNLIGQQIKNCESWDNKLGKFVERDTWLIAKGDLPPYKRNELINSLPGKTIKSS